MLSLCLAYDGISEWQMLRLSQGMLEKYISGAHIQVDQRQSYACNMIVAYGGHCQYGI